MEFGGPFQGKSFLVIVNAYSKWRLWQWMKPPDRTVDELHARSINMAPKAPSSSGR